MVAKLFFPRFALIEISFVINLCSSYALLYFLKRIKEREVIKSMPKVGTSRKIMERGVLFCLIIFRLKKKNNNQLGTQTRFE